MAADGARFGYIPSLWMNRLDALPQPPAIMSDRIKDLLSRALVGPVALTEDEVRELAASVVFHLCKVREEENLPPGPDPKP